MGRGRPRKTDQQRAIEGETHMDRFVGHVKADGVPRRPARMSKEAAWLWDLVVQHWMCELDTAELLTLCDTWEMLRAATQAAKDDPMNPEVRNSFVRYKAEFDKLAARFGMSPADRTKIKIPDESKEDTKESKYFGVVG